MSFEMKTEFLQYPIIIYSELIIFICEPNANLISLTKLVKIKKKWFENRRYRRMAVKYHLKSVFEKSL